jgi:tRNA pseudouridine55 synthase
VKVGGERAYRRARRGEHFELPERTVTVTRFSERWREGELACFDIECSAGTYVRSLISDLGDAYCETLRRTAIGPFDVCDAVAPPLGHRAPKVRARERGAEAAAPDQPVPGRPDPGQWLPGAPAELTIEQALDAL